MYVLDEYWYTRLSEIITDADYAWARAFAKVSSRERARFFQNEIENPRLRCEVACDVHASLTQLRMLGDEIAREEKNEIVRTLYEEKIALHTQHMLMFQCIQEGDDAGFFEKSTGVYGRPKKAFFAYVALRMQDLLAKTKEVEHIQAHTLLSAIFSKIDTSQSITRVDMLPEQTLDTSSRIQATYVVKIFTETLLHYGIGNWSVVVAGPEERQRFSVNLHQRVVYIPHDDVLARRKAPLTERGAYAIAEHEIGVHVRRAYEAEKQPLKLLVSGLAGHLRGEEGIAGYVQQQIEGADEFYGFDRYLAASLAVGMDGIARDFRSVYSCMYAYYLLTLKKNGSLPDNAHHAAWEVTVRIFRGSTGGSVGTIFTRDIVYLEGNIGIWHKLSEMPHIFDSFFVGKYDPLNDAHVSALQALEILPQW